MEHVEETILALYILDAPEVKERRAQIASHLDQCAGCAQLYGEMKEYYAEVDALHVEGVEGTYPALVASGRIARSSLESDRGPLRSLSHSAVQIVVASFKTYPARWSGGFALVMVALLLLIPKLFMLDKNPAYVRAKDEFIIALNNNGEELWRRYVVPGFESGTRQILGMPTVVDLDGDGKREIIVVSLPGPSLLHGRIGCFNADGAERWRFEFHPKKDFDKEAFSGDYDLEPTLALRDFERNGKYEMAFAAHNSAWWPSVVGLLDAKDGKALGEYWHPGWLRIAAKDVDEDGIEEVLAVGYNNAFKKNVLAVLDPRNIDGYAPATTEFTPQGVSRAAEKFYILLPDPDLFQLPNRLPVSRGSDFLESGSLAFKTVRYVSVGKLGSRAAEVFFDFDKHLNCVSVRVADEFADLHHIFEKEGKIKKKLDAQYFEDLRRGVKYWDGEKFVKEPTMNKKYQQAISKGE